MFNVVLVEPEIPPNTGNVIRLCANTGCALHLVGPLGFVLEDAKLRRAGLDYHEFTRLRSYPSFANFWTEHGHAQERFFALSTKAQNSLFSRRFQPGDYFLFGRETAGLSAEVVAQCAETLHLPMQPNSLSLNLGNSVAVTVYEAWRQNDFATKS